MVKSVVLITLLLSESPARWVPISTFVIENPLRATLPELARYLGSFTRQLYVPVGMLLTVTVAVLVAVAVEVGELVSVGVLLGVGVIVGVFVRVGVRVSVGVEDTPQMYTGEALLRGVSGFDVAKSAALLSVSVQPLFKR